MRRLDLHPRRKLRNPARHVRGLARWPERIVTQLPTVERADGVRFWNFKVPVYSKVVDPPHATQETQRACIGAMFAAAEAIERSPLRPKDCRVACLVTTPFLFESEVTLFFDEDYFQTFLPAAAANAKRAKYDGGWVEGGPSKDTAGIEAIMPPAPEGLVFEGGVWLRQFEEGRGLLPERTTWVWAYPRH
jgi:hypothetical protein